MASYRWLPAFANPFIKLTIPFRCWYSPQIAGTNPFPGDTNPFYDGTDPFSGGTEPFSGSTEPFSEDTNPFSGGTNPFQRRHTAQFCLYNSLFRRCNAAPRWYKDLSARTTRSHETLTASFKQLFSCPTFIPG